MTLRAVPVTIENGVVRAVDGSLLPEHAFALLVILPSSTSEPAAEEWQRRFDEFFASVESQSLRGLDELSDDELNRLIHSAREVS